MRAWVRFFVGTPQRFLYTLLGLAVIAVLVKPGLLALAVNRLISEISPAIGPAIQFGVTIAIIVFMARAILGTGKGGK